jgi:dissimilatory sulfite reductase related protein
MSTVAAENTALDGEGYLIDPESWNEAVARQLASAEEISLTDDHWKVIQFMRERYRENGVAVDARFVIKYLADDLGYGDRAKARLFELFPYGYVKQACRIAGMRRPRAWSTG